MIRQDEMFAEELAGSGWRMAKLQMYNWGAYHGKIFTTEMGDTASLLIGMNGGGKSTLIDAILTLLVPPGHRTYNSASGSSIKRDRTLKDYVSGHYADRQEGDSEQMVESNLRGSDDFSALLCVLRNATATGSFTMFQFFHYQGASDAPATVCALAEGEVSLEQINAVCGPFRKGTDRWVGRLHHFSQELGAMFYPSFREYNEAFKNRVGMRSDRGLRLFSRAVGIKAIDDLDAFVTTFLLDPSRDIEATYRKLAAAADKYRDSEAEFVRTEKRYQRLHDIVQIGEISRNMSADALLHTCVRDALPLWRAEMKLRMVDALLEDARREEQSSAAKYEDLSTQVDDLKRRRDGDTRRIELERLSGQMQMHERDIRDRKTARDAMIRYLSLLSMAAPRDIASFERLISSIPDIISHKRQRIARLVETQEMLHGQHAEVRSLLQVAKEELTAMGDADSNIPGPYLVARKALAQRLGCLPAQLPFAGELMQVSQASGQWRDGVEHLVRDLALTVLVPGSIANLPVVSQVLWDHAFEVRLSVVVVPGDPGIDFSGGQVFAEDVLAEQGRNGDAHVLSGTVAGMLEYKDITELCRWLPVEVRRRFGHLSVQDAASMASTEASFGIVGLVRTGSGLDRASASVQGQRMIRCLGWDTAEKRRHLKDEIASLEIRRSELQRQLAQSEEEKDALRSALEAAARLGEYRSFDTIDVHGMEIIILETQKRIDALSRVRADLDRLQAEIDRLVELRDDASSNRRIARDAVAHLEQQKADALAVGAASEDSVRFAAVETVVRQYPEVASMQTLEQVDMRYRTLDADLVRQISEEDREAQRSLEQFLRMYRDYREAQDLSRNIPEWRQQFATYGEDIGALASLQADLQRMENEHQYQNEESLRRRVGRDLDICLTHVRKALDDGRRSVSAGLQEINEGLASVMFRKDRQTFIRLKSLRLSRPTGAKARGFEEQLKDLTMVIASHGNDEALRSAEDVERWNRIAHFTEDTAQIYGKAELERMFDVRLWYEYVAEEYRPGEEGRIASYRGTSIGSGGEKTMLTYTLLCAAVASQYGVLRPEGKSSSFRFVILDEAFGKLDGFNEEIAFSLFKSLDLQLLVTVPSKSEQDQDRVVQIMRPHLKSVLVANRVPRIGSLSVNEIKLVE